MSTENSFTDIISRTYEESVTETFGTFEKGDKVSIKLIDSFYQLHSLIGPAIEYTNGSKEWWVSGKLHREDGPAIEYVNGAKHWFVNGKRHRIFGPAIEFGNGQVAFYLNNVEYEQKKYYELLEELVK